MRYFLHRYYYLCLLALGLIFHDAKSQGHFSLKKYTVKDGLPDSYVLTIFQDSRGFLWIGTTNGISRFDGKNFVNYNLNDGLPSLSAGVFFEDSVHTLWASSRRGMAAFRDNHFHTYPLSDSATFDYASLGYIKSMGIIANTSYGNYRFEKDHWQKIKCYPGLDNNSCHQVIEAKEGIYFNYGDHLVLKRGNNYELLGQKTGKYGPYFRGLRSFDDGTYLITEDGIFRINGDQRLPIFAQTLRNKTVYAFYKDAKQRYWVCTDEDGLMVSEPGNTKEFTWHIPVTQNLVSGFYEDRSGNLWIACIDGLGLINEKDVTRFTKNISDVYSLMETPRNKHILAYSRSSGLLNFNGKDFKPSVFSLRTSKGDLIDYYCADDQDRLWFSTRYQRLFCMDNESIKDYSSLAGRTLNIYAADYNFKKRRLSIAADTLKVGDERIQRTFISTNSQQWLLHPIMNHSFKNGLQIVTTRFDGSFLIDEKDNCIPINKELQLPKTISGFRFLEEAGGNFWIFGNGTGMSRYHWNAHGLPEKDLEITTSDGLPNNIVNSMCIDKYQRVWAVTPSGLVLILPDSSGRGQHAIYDIGNTLEIDPVNLEYAKLLTASDGNIWLSKYSEIIRFSPDSISPKSVVPLVSIESIRILSPSGKLLEKFRSLQHYWSATEPARFRYNENSLQIYFNGISFENYSGLKFSYRLDGLDSNWSQPDQNASITYVKLSPGDYTFYVRAKTSASRWSTPATFSFIIKTPYWETWWFKLGIILFASAIIISIFRYRLGQLRRRAGMQNQIRELEMKALKAQMNPHFIHNALNSIQSLIINNRSNEASHYVSKFAKLLRQVLENADSNLISLDKELYSLRLYVDLEKLRLDMEVDYAEEMEENIVPAEVRIPPLILQPFVENALWHGLSNKPGNKKILVCISEKKGWIICEITDNGVGRKKAGEPGKPFPEGSFSKAVSITTQRLADFNQSPETEPVSFIDLYNENEPAGTTVIIRINISH